jgi:glucuronoarabinoxylan endo-1,4-beta-xylanase
MVKYKDFPGVREKKQIIFWLLVVQGIWAAAQVPEERQLIIYPDSMFQTVEGFGASLAFYEGWLTAHPNKNQIYQAIFGELSMDILRLRNAHDYDPGMVDRAQEFVQAAESALGYPIAVLSTSWGPPGYLKSNGDKSNGGTLRYTVAGDSVQFDYGAFAGWWDSSLDEYEAHGIFPEFISIQNEPDYSATWESCRLSPSETISASDTIAGYNLALDAVYDSVQKRDHVPRFLGPETVGIGYNSVENYVNALDLSKLDGIAHHLYHGVNADNPYTSTDFQKVGGFHPEVPHFQTEYSLGDWFSLAGLIYRSFRDEKVVAYLYWDLIWDGAGLVALDFPWDRSRWIDPARGYTKTREFYVFKQFSAFVHPGWRMTWNTISGSGLAVLTFNSPTGDSASCILINRSQEEVSVHMALPGYRIDSSAIYRTSDQEECIYLGSMADSLLTIPPRSVTTVEMRLSEFTGPVIHSCVPESDILMDSACVAILPDFTGSPGLQIEESTPYMVTQRPEAGSVIGDTTMVRIIVTRESGDSATCRFRVNTLDGIAPVLETCLPDVTVELDSTDRAIIADYTGSTELVISDCSPFTVTQSPAAGTVFSDTTRVLITVTDLHDNHSTCSFAVNVLPYSGPGDTTAINNGTGRQVKLYPNPFSHSATLEISVKESGPGWLRIYDSTGRLVRTVSLGDLPAGDHTIPMVRDGLTEGIYMLRVTGGDGSSYRGRFVIH